MRERSTIYELVSPWAGRRVRRLLWARPTTTRRVRAALSPFCGFKVQIGPYPLTQKSDTKPTATRRDGEAKAEADVNCALTWLYK